MDTTPRGAGGSGRPAVDERNLNEVVIARRVAEKAAPFADDRVYAGEVVDVTGKLAKRAGQGVHDMLVQFHGVDVGGARLQRGEDVASATGADDADAVGRLELIADAGHIEKQVR
jgi:hypothetical protein